MSKTKIKVTEDTIKYHIKRIKILLRKNQSLKNIQNKLNSTAAKITRPETCKRNKTIIIIKTYFEHQSEIIYEFFTKSFRYVEYVIDNLLMHIFKISQYEFTVHAHHVVVDNLLKYRV